MGDVRANPDDCRPREAPACWARVADVGAVLGDEQAAAAGCDTIVVDEVRDRAQRLDLVAQPPRSRLELAAPGSSPAHALMANSRASGALETSLDTGTLLRYDGAGQWWTSRPGQVVLGR